MSIQLPPALAEFFAAAEAKGLGVTAARDAALALAGNVAKAGLVDEMTAKNKGYEKTIAELKATHAAELTQVREAGARALVFQSKGLGSESARAYVEQAFTKQAAGEGGEKDFGKWLDAVVTDPAKGNDDVLSAVLAQFAKPAAQSGQAGAQAGAQGGVGAGQAGAQGAQAGAQGGAQSGAQFGNRVDATKPAASTGAATGPEMAQTKEGWAAIQAQNPQLQGLPAPWLN